MEFFFTYISADVFVSIYSDFCHSDVFFVFIFQLKDYFTLKENKKKYFHKKLLNSLYCLQSLEHQMRFLPNFKQDNFVVCVLI